MKNMEHRIIELVDRIFDQIGGPWKENNEIEILINLHSINLPREMTAGLFLDEIGELSNDRHDAEHSKNEEAQGLVNLRAINLVNSLFAANDVKKSYI